MPTLIRLFVVLLVLAGLAFGGMVALVAMVTPKEKEVTIRIPARDLVPSRERDPLVTREIDTNRQAPAAEPAPATEAEPVAEPAPTKTAKSSRWLPVSNDRDVPGRGVPRDDERRARRREEHP
jgi:hypothetical protein